MSGVWGRSIRYSIFGESHGAALGIVIDGLMPGIKLDLDEIKFEMGRRSPGNSEWSTPRREEDNFEIISGFFNDMTTGAPLCAVIKNTNVRSKDYDKVKNVMRPGHADYTANIKYNGFNDYRGGGHFSGRITAGLVFAGAVSKQILYKYDIVIGSDIYKIGNINDRPFDKVNVNADILKDLRLKPFPVIDEEKGAGMRKLILQSRCEMDSVGGVVEAAIVNVPPGIGEPFFDSLESTLSHLLFSIPAVKGVEFGEGFNIASMKGSEANDELQYNGHKVKTLTNNNGGILGGITNGMPVVFRAAFKPTPSIAKPQNTIDIKKKENTKIEIVGRHDPCIVPRVLPVVEAAAAMAVLDLLQVMGPSLDTRSQGSPGGGR